MLGTILWQPERSRVLSQRSTHIRELNGSPSFAVRSTAADAFQQSARMAYIIFRNCMAAIYGRKNAQKAQKQQGNGHSFLRFLSLFAATVLFNLL